MSQLAEIQRQREEIEKQFAEQLKQLETKEKQIASEAKSKALNKVKDAIKELNALGYSYSLTEGIKTTRTRTGGKTAKVLEAIKANPSGIDRATLLSTMNATDDKAIASISASINSLKKKGLITGERGHYIATN